MVDRAASASREGTPSARVVRFRQAAPEQRAQGLQGWLAIEFGPVRVDGITLRRTAGGRYALSFPRRVDAGDREHAIVRPLDDAARVAIERAVLDQLELDEEGTP